MTEEHAGSVRISNAQIFEELRLTRSEVSSVRQSIDETIKPDLATVKVEVRNLEKNKAEKAETAKLEGTINSVRLQAYAIPGGVIAGLIALNALGILPLVPT